MKRILTLSAVVLALLAGAQESKSQILTNNGALIYINTNAVVRMCGVVDNNANGTITVQDSASLRVDGSVNVNSGSLSFNAASTGLVTVDLLTAGTCNLVSGTLNRNGSGTLHVQGNVNNKGATNNSSLIIIDGNWNNEGIVNNNTGAVMDIGQP